MSFMYDLALCSRVQQEWRWQNLVLCMMVTLDNALFWPVQSPQLRALICPYTQQSCMMIMRTELQRTRHQRDRSVFASVHFSKFNCGVWEPYHAPVLPAQSWQSWQRSTSRLSRTKPETSTGFLWSITHWNKEIRRRQTRERDRSPIYLHTEKFPPFSTSLFLSDSLSGPHKLALVWIPNLTLFTMVQILRNLTDHSPSYDQSKYSYCFPFRFLWKQAPNRTYFQGGQKIDVDSLFHKKVGPLYGLYVYIGNTYGVNICVCTHNLWAFVYIWGKSELDLAIWYFSQ